MQKLLQEYKAWRKEILAYNYMFTWQDGILRLMRAAAT